MFQATAVTARHHDQYTHAKLIQQPTPQQDSVSSCLPLRGFFIASKKNQFAPGHPGRRLCKFCSARCCWGLQNSCSSNRSGC